MTTINLRNKDGLQSAAAVAFILTVFYGDVDIGIVVPLCMLLLPFFLLPFIRSIRIPPLLPLVFLSVLFGCVFVQILLNRPPDRSDAALYLPIIYAACSYFLCYQFSLTAEYVGRALIFGALLVIGLAVMTMTVLPPGDYPIKGQDFTETAKEYKEIAKAEGIPLAAVADPQETGRTGFYAAKNLVRSPLGRSNYIAVFLVFCFSVALFTKQPIPAVICALGAIMTLSRIGMICLCLIGSLWMLSTIDRRYRERIFMCALAVASLALIYLLYIVTSDKANPLPSLHARLSYATSAIDMIKSYLWFGAPRSYVVEQAAKSIIWSPHNGAMGIAINFGIGGLIAYGAYIAFMLRRFYLNAKQSLLWKGVFVGACVLLLWSNAEIIVMTPAFDILMAGLFGIAIRESKRHP